jgi:hypothetical protein
MIQTEYSKIIRKIAVEKGKEVFLEPKKLKPFLFDYTKNEYKRENAFLLSVLDTDCVKYIDNAEDLAECKQFLLKRLDDEYGLSPTRSAEMLDILFLVFRGASVQSLNETRKSIARFQTCIAIGYGPKTNHNRADQCDTKNLQDIIANSSSHVVGLNADGTAATTGSNEWGQCNTQNWRDIIAIAAGLELTAGIKSDGSLIVTGGFNFSQEKINAIMVSIGVKCLAVLVKEGFVIVIDKNNECGRCNTESWRDITSVSAGFYHTAGLREDGTVAAVGLNDDGQCETQGWRDIVSISAGYNNTLAVRTDGTVVKAGKNCSDMCEIQNWRDIVAVSAGMVHTAGLKSDGTVVATGNNSFGQCNVQGWKDFIAVHAGLFNTVGLKADGTVVVCGLNQFGQCNTQSWRNIGLFKDERLD